MDPNQTSGIHKIGDTVANIIADTLAGDLGLRTRAVQSTGRTTGLPTLHFMTAAKARLAFTVVARGKKSFLFNLFGATRAEKVADVRIKFEINPSRTVQAVSSNAPGLFLAFPDFVDIHRTSGSLGVELPNNRDCEVRDGGSGRLVVSRPDGHTRSFAPDGLGADTVFDFLASLVRWVRTGSSASPVRLSQPTDAGNDRIDTLLENVASAYRKASRTIRLDRTGLRGEDQLSIKLRNLQDADRRLAGVHADLAGPYRFGSLRADVLVKIGADGRLVQKVASEDAQQFDLRTWIDPREPDAINVSLRLSDLLCEGEIFESFAQFLVDDPEAGPQMAERVNRAGLEMPGGGSLPGDAEEMIRLIRGARRDEALYFVRLREQEDDDIEAFYVAGRYAGHNVEFVFGARLKVDNFPNVVPTKLSKVTLVAARIAGGQWRIFEDDGYWALILAFLERFFSILLTWKGRVADTRS
ncbi:MAG: hypothetical protein GY791_07025 [Alphaproteobacteria bacterium]|nr:hypothetical protein [Alphaproteobacteria bacterium]